MRTIIILAYVLSPALLFGSPASALREYKAGQYDQALKEYEQLLQRKSDDPRLHFNAGTAAYRQRQFEEAAKQFDAALSSPDLKLQAPTYYNRGNSLFYLGQNIPDPKQRTDAWKKALQDYQSAMKLNPKDADAKYNFDFVKKRLEELQQQQQQQSNQDKSDQEQNQDQQKQKQQNQQKQDQKKEQNQQQQQGQQQQADKKQEQDKQQQAQQQKQEEQKQEQAQNQQQQQAKQASAQPEEKSEGNEKKEEKAYAEGQMTPEQAEQLLDAQKGEEQMLPPVKPESKPEDRNRPIKDW
jgi:Ca-activated chloride channel family protein